MSKDKPMKVKRGRVYRCRSNGQLYAVRGVSAVKLDGEWVKAGIVLYSPVRLAKSGALRLRNRAYARLTADFLASFDDVTRNSRRS